MTLPPGTGPGDRGDTSVRERPADSGGSGRTVQAAGVVCWRPVPGATDPAGGIEVLLVHGTRHQEWSWPKGKRQSDETGPECAVRETAEETGVGVVLGRPLPAARYALPDGRPKHVAYWAAQPAAAGESALGGNPVAHDPAPPAEVDGTQWVSLARARELLPHAENHAPLDAVARMATEGTLDTRPLLLLRHASSFPRTRWTPPDAQRPLSEEGHRQAAALPRLLACWRPTRLVTSPWRRCVDTIAGYLTATGQTARAEPRLSEEGLLRDPKAPGEEVDGMLSAGEPALLCTHRPVLGEALQAIRDHAAPEVVVHLPDRDPFLEPGEVLVAHALPRRHLVVAVERHRLGSGDPFTGVLPG